MGMSPLVHFLCCKMSFLIRSNAIGNIPLVHGLLMTEALGVMKANSLTEVMSILVKLNFYSTVPNLYHIAGYFAPGSGVMPGRADFCHGQIRYLAVLGKSFLARRRPHYWPECIPLNLITMATLFMGPLSKPWDVERKKQVNMLRTYMSFCLSD